MAQQSCFEINWPLVAKEISIKKRTNKVDDKKSQYTCEVLYLKIYGNYKSDWSVFMLIRIPW